MCRQQGLAEGLPWVGTGVVCMWLTCCCRCLVSEQSGLAARDDLEARVLRGLGQALGSGSQECIEVLQPRDLEHRKHYLAGATCETRWR